MFSAPISTMLSRTAASSCLALSLSRYIVAVALVEVSFCFCEIFLMTQKLQQIRKLVTYPPSDRKTSGLHPQRAIAKGHYFHGGWWERAVLKSTAHATDPTVANATRAKAKRSPRSRSAALSRSAPPGTQART